MMDQHEIQSRRVAEMTKKAHSMGISYDEYCSRLVAAARAQREWIETLFALGWGPNDNPTAFLRRLNNRTK